MIIKYNKEKLKEIYNIARSSINKTIREIVKDEIIDNKYLENKGKIGNLIQEYLFNIPVNNKSAPDFEELSLELKVIPLKLGKKNQKLIKERMVLNTINFNDIVKENFESSSFLTKNKLILVMTYIHEYEKDKLDFKINDAFIFDISKQEEYKIIQNDWDKIVNMIKQGRAENLSEKMTKILGACTKGKNKSSIKTQPYSNNKAKQRAFSYKARFLKILIEKNINRIDYFNEIFKNEEVEYLNDYSDETITNYFDSIIDKDLTSFLYSKAKHKHRLAFDKFIKNDNEKLFNYLKSQNIKYTVKISNQNVIQEDINTGYDLDPFEIIHEDFENSTFYQEVILKTFFIIIIDKNTNIIKNYKIFNFDNDSILNSEIVFNDTKNKLNNLFEINSKERILPNFIKSSHNYTIHIRPHASKAEITYKRKNKELKITKQCFWINKRDIK